MLQEQLSLDGIPAILWGGVSHGVYIHVHGKMSRKEYAEDFARIAQERGWQTLSFDLPRHGERAGQGPACTLQNGISDLNRIANFAFGRWKKVSLFACSLGAHFALRAYTARPLEKCLFLSPIVDMQWLAEQMMRWFGVTEEQLQREKEIDTPIDTLRWADYQYILAHPIGPWPHPTSILYAGKDHLQPESVMRAFAQAHHALLTVAPHSQHPFMEAADRSLVERWLREQVQPER